MQISKCADTKNGKDNDDIIEKIGKGKAKNKYPRRTK